MGQGEPASGALTPRPAAAAPATPSEPAAVATAWLLGYTGHTRAAYGRDLRSWSAWLDAHGLHAWTVTRAHVDVYARALEEQPLAPATVARRLSTLAGFYRYALEEGVIDRSPLAHVRRPRVDMESATLGLDRDELARLLDVAERTNPRAYALACLLAINGLRIAEALSADVADLGTSRGHRTLEIVRKRGKRATVPLAPRTAAAIDTYLAGRADGPIFATSTGRRLDRSSGAKTIRRLAIAAGIAKAISPHSLRHSFVTLALDTGASLRDVQDAAGHASPVTTRRYDRARHNLDRNPTYAVAAHLAE